MTDPDNSESSSTAYDCSGRGYTAGGDGSFNNPLTYATASGSSLHSPCEVTWFPYLEKYLVMQDTCAGCEDLQIDVWIGNGNGGQSELNCENNSPSGNGHKLIRYGSSSHNANTNALWSKNGGCQVRGRGFCLARSSCLLISGLEQRLPQRQLGCQSWFSKLKPACPKCKHRKVEMALENKP